MVHDEIELKIQKANSVKKQNSNILFLDYAVLLFNCAWQHSFRWNEVEVERVLRAGILH